MNDVKPSARVWRQFPPETRELLERGLSPTDLQSLLLDVAQHRAADVTPSRVTRRWAQDRFVRPSAHDARAINAVEHRLWSLLPAHFSGVDLSPVVPMGTCAAVGPVDQNRVVTTMRGTEVLSDPTNALAVEAAARRCGQPRDGRVDLACAHRVLRAQAFAGTNAAGQPWASHFRLFCLVSSARDRGDHRTEAQMLADHAGFWSAALTDLLSSPPHSGPPDGCRARIEFTAFASAGLRRRWAEVAQTFTSQSVELVEDPERTRARGYYAGGALRVEVGEVEIGDGGFTTWTAQLMGDAKERCLVSCLSTEGLLDVIGQG